MQDVREGDTLWSYWIAVDAKGDPIDLTSVTDVDVEVALQRNGRVVGPKIDIPGAETVPGTPGLWRHQYETLAPGVYFLTVTFTGLPGVGTAPTRQNALLNVVARL